jgi:hypothetical protein
MAKFLTASDISVVTLSPFSAVSPFDCSPRPALDDNNHNDSGGQDGFDDQDDSDSGRNC